MSVSKSSWKPLAGIGILVIQYVQTAGVLKHYLILFTVIGCNDGDSGGKMFGGSRVLRQCPLQHAGVSPTCAAVNSARLALTGFVKSFPGYEYFCNPHYTFGRMSSPRSHPWLSLPPCEG
ncbi:hypothetical protein DFJ58DRAFT_889315 [Suillus subalutaceus]|uniref:uncharacterized protein n=1 Tax=Suillus subalutaceus TaxID=48586 RepID=UPI001B85C2CD|nr:uncharacterized protein DFJ58DRAFT_889315 [Suillus subalutaceus]KAG1849155.1 hypothetical protein DFJ58DRAFT_889315 [Suillus subalutaceus]